MLSETMARVDELLGLVSKRKLSASQRDELDAAATFLSQAREALESGDHDRADVLAEKSLVLIQELEWASR